MKEGVYWNTLRHTFLIVKYCKPSSKNYVVLWLDNKTQLPFTRTTFAGFLNSPFWSSYSRFIKYIGEF